MANKDSESGASPSVSKKALAKVEKNIAEIQKWYDVGRKLADACPTYAQDGLIKKQAEKLGIRAATARTYRQMSGLYTQADMDKLYQKFRKNLFALTISHFVHLVTVEDSRERKAITLEAVEGRLSVSQLHKLKLQRFGNKNSNAGRIPDNIKAEGKQALVDAVKSELAGWLRWLNLALKHHGGARSKLSASLKTLMSEITGVHQLSQK